MSIFGRSLIQVMIVVVLATGLYASTLGHNFVMDDGAVIGDNETVQMGLSGVPRILSSPYWSGSGHFENGYRPLSLVMFAIEYEIFGLSPQVGHTVNVILYGLTAIALLYLMRRLVALARAANILPQDDIWQWFPLLVTVLFVAHPVHTEVVANIKSRDEILALLSGLLSVFLFLRYFSSGRRHLLFGSVSLFFLAMFAKESALTLLAIMPVLALGLKVTDIRRTLVVMTPFVIVALVFLCIRFAVLDDFVFARDGLELTQNSVAMAVAPDSQWATALMVVGRYMALMVYPYPLVSDYSFPQIPPVSWSAVSVMLSIATMTGLLALAARTWRTNFLVSAGILWFFITLSVASNLVVLIGVTMAERLLYTPSVGFSMVFSALLIQITASLNYPAAKQALVLMLTGALAMTGWGVLTLNRNQDWYNDVTLITKDVKVHGESAILRFSYGSALAAVADSLSDDTRKQQLLDESLRQFEQATVLLPRYASAWDAQGQLYERAGLYDRAESMYMQAITLDDDQPAFVRHLERVRRLRDAAAGGQD